MMVFIYPFETGLCNGVLRFRVNKWLHSQWMASIAMSVMGFIDYLGYATISTCEMYSSVVVGQKYDFFPARKAQDVCWEVVPGFKNWLKV
jgi:hypothetical protein